MTCERSPKRLPKARSDVLKDRISKRSVQQSLRLRYFDNREKKVALPRTDLFANDTQVMLQDLADALEDVQRQIAGQKADDTKNALIKNE